MRRVVATALLLAALPAAAAGSDTVGRTTVEQRIAGGDRATAPFSFLRPAAGQPHRVREDLTAAKPGRDDRRRTIIHFAQLSDFQLTDEESPARVEYLDRLHEIGKAAQRPQEALLPFLVDASIRQVNALRDTSPVAQGDGERHGIDLVIATGDNADNQQYNETLWVATLLRGGVVEPNSGSDDPADYAACPEVPVETTPVYTGVQDYDDYAETTIHYDPDDPQGDYVQWPRYPGLLDRAQQPFHATGLQVPSYVAVGNHDLLAQGNQAANPAFDAIAQGCRKVMGGSLNGDDPSGGFSDALLTSSPQNTINVPPDPDRRYVTAPEYKALFGAGEDAHGFAFVDAEELEASRGAAAYYSFSPRPGLRLVALDSVANGGIAEDSNEGNIDDPQYRWLEGVLKAAEAADELVIVYSHHGPQSMDAIAPDEVTGPCAGAADPDDEPNPGCDLDPRISEPLHHAAEMVELLHRFPHVVAWVAGHSHVNDVTAYKRESGGGFWVVRTSAEADWPHQDRLVEVMDNRDGTLSIFGTLIDNAAPVAAPPTDTAAAGLDIDQLASIGRTLGYNDPQIGGGTGESQLDPGETGPADDQNVELLIDDPRRTPDRGVERERSRVRVRVAPQKLRAGRRTRLRIRVTAGGRPVRGARVVLRGARVKVSGRRLRTNPRGRTTVRLRPRRAGVLRVIVTLPGHRRAVVRVPVRRRR